MPRNTDRVRNESAPRRLAGRKTMCKIFVGSVVTELTTQEPRTIDRPRNALAPGPAWRKNPRILI